MRKDLQQWIMFQIFLRLITLIYDELKLFSTESFALHIAKA